VIHPLEYPLNIKTDLFADYGNVSNQPVQKEKPQHSKRTSIFLLRGLLPKKTAQELMTIMSSEWLKELEALFDVIRLLSCFTTFVVS